MFGSPLFCFAVTFGMVYVYLRRRRCPIEPDTFNIFFHFSCFSVDVRAIYGTVARGDDDADCPTQLEHADGRGIPASRASSLHPVVVGARELSVLDEKESILQMRSYHAPIGTSKAVFPVLRKSPTDGLYWCLCGASDGVTITRKSRPQPTRKTCAWQTAKRCAWRPLSVGSSPSCRAYPPGKAMLDRRE